MEDDIIKEIAKSEVVGNAEGIRIVLDEHSAAFRWLMASFLAINSGGLFALADEFEHSLANVIAGSGFYLGIVCSLGIGWLGQRAARRSIEPMKKLQIYWIETATTGDFDENKFNALTDELKKAGVSNSRYFGWASLLFFTIGVLGMACATGRSDVSVTALVSSISDTSTS